MSIPDPIPEEFPADFAETRTELGDSACIEEEFRIARRLLASHDLDGLAKFLGRRNRERACKAAERARR